MRFEHGATADGRFVVRGGADRARRRRVRLELTRGCLNAASTGAGPYDVPNAYIDCYAVYTNNPPCGAMRGFGAVQVCSAYEAHDGQAAAEVGVDPVEMRMRNAMATGTVMPTAR